jgi:hypothetical protein
MAASRVACHISTHFACHINRLVALSLLLNVQQHAEVCRKLLESCLMLAATLVAIRHAFTPVL